MNHLLKKLGLKIIYNDKDIIILDKPAGLIVHKAQFDESTLTDFSSKVSSDIEDKNRPGIVHRLDKNTSGLIIVAKTTSAKNYFKELFRLHKIKKTYIALIEGIISPTEAIIKLPIQRSKKEPTRRAVNPTGKLAITKYKLIKKYPNFSLIRVQPETGRTHQIRVHFSYLGHPIAGDNLYGSNKNRLKNLHRQFLHASELAFRLPTGEKINVKSILPQDLEDCLASLAKTSL